MLVLEIRDPRGALLQPLEPAEQTCGTAEEPATRGWMEPGVPGHLFSFSFPWQ